MQGKNAMGLKRTILSRPKLTTSIAAGIAAVALASGGYAIANSGSSSSANGATAGKVVPFDRGNPSAATPVGQVPANFTDGSGTIVTGTAANKARAAALAAYPGGIVNRVALLSNGEYNVHMIAVNWPHHVFVDATFKAVGAE
jgi:ABC-type glycerol-3-phosphate transport system substrate-binding protein